MTGPDVRPVDGTPVCDAVAHLCRCRADAGHYPDTPHACPCGGSWRGDIDGDSFEVLTFPPAAPVPGLEAGEVW